ncbi:MAG TPA: VWA domain-containing protein [Blastocatellia bacterium]|nr:VWA domain-containing protein [Blastocatellia bacterium]
MGIKRLATLLAVSILALSPALPGAGSAAQSGKGNASSRRLVTLNVIVHAPESKLVSKEDFELYDAGIPQDVETFSRLDAGSRVVLLVDSSANLKAEQTLLQQAVTAVVNELYDDDQMMVVGYNETAEIIEDMTPDLAKLQTSPTKLIRKGFPNLYDALIAVSDALSHQAKTGLEKRAIILISDGYDSESKTKFDAALVELQRENVILYAIQVPDRTRGALLKDKPKPPAALAQLTEGTGGTLYSFDKAADAAKRIADDMRKNWYRLTYTPEGVNPINTRRLLLMSHIDGIEFRTKGSHPGRYN